MTCQTTIAAPIAFSGVGLHSGTEVNITIHPAAADHGIRFTALLNGAQTPVNIPALAAAVGQTAYATSLCADGAALQTVEHLLAALAGLDIDNANIHIDANEVPIMDGSALPFVRAILATGIQTLDAPRTVLRIIQPIRIEADGGDKWIEIHPLEDSREATLEVDYQIDFSHATIGRQRFHYHHSPENFATELAGARTFGLASEVEALRQAGLARGGSLDNAVVIGDDGVINPEGLRMADELVRHKVLDLLGDLSLTGAPVLGRIVAHRAGHQLHTLLAQAILDQPLAVERVTLNAPLLMDAACAA